MNLANEVGGEGADSLQVLWEDGERAFCRQRSNAEQTTVLVVVSAAEHPSPAGLERLAHEFSLKDELDPAWAVRPLELKRDRGRTLLVLQDPGGEPLARRLGSPLDMAQVLPLAIDTAWSTNCTAGLPPRSWRLSTRSVSSSASLTLLADP